MNCLSFLIIKLSPLAFQSKISQVIIFIISYIFFNSTVLVLDYLKNTHAISFLGVPLIRKQGKCIDACTFLRFSLAGKSQKLLVGADRLKPGCAGPGWKGGFYRKQNDLTNAGIAGMVNIRCIYKMN